MATKAKIRKADRKTLPTTLPASSSAEAEPVDEIAEFLNFGTAKELKRDDIEWRALLANTTDEQLLALEKRSLESAKKTSAVVLGFSDK